MSTEQEQVQVRFVTKQQRYAVRDAAILVPANFKRYGLSEIINNLLGLGKFITRLVCRLPPSHPSCLIDKPIPFEFLIDGEILRSSIADYLTAQQLSTVTSSHRPLTF